MTGTVAVILVLGALIFFHELGHFLVARFFGVGVKTFALGFGPTLFSIKKGQTDYKLCLIPLGGYVAMVAESSPDDIPEGFTEKESFALRGPLQRMAIIAAGPIFNFVLAWILLFCVYFFGGEQGIAPVVGELEKKGPAFTAGLQYEDRIIKINGKEVMLVADVEKAAYKSKDTPLTLTVRRGGAVFDVQATPQPKKGTNVFGEQDTYYSLGISWAAKSIVQDVTPKSPAAQAGILPGDIILTVNSMPMRSYSSVSKTVQANKESPLTVSVNRQGEILEFINIIPKMQEVKDDFGNIHQLYLMGVRLTMQPENAFRPVGFGQSMAIAVTKTWEYCELIVKGVGKMISRTVSVDNIGGPILLAQMVSQGAEQGLIPVLMLAALISINLGLLNLLPIPVLDGGHILFCGIEFVFRRPVPEKIQEITVKIGLTFLLALMALAIFNDLVRVFS